MRAFTSTKPKICDENMDWTSSILKAFNVVRPNGQMTLRDLDLPKHKGNICLIIKIKQKVLNKLSSISRLNIRSEDRITISRSNI